MRVPGGPLACHLSVQVIGFCTSFEVAADEAAKRFARQRESAADASGMLPFRT